MIKKSTAQIQVRIDAATKREVRKFLEEIGLDVSTAVKIFFKQIQRTRSLPFDINQCAHPHVMSKKNALLVKKAFREKKSEGKRFTSVRALMRDLAR